jgi:hypothetical protein
LLKVLFLIEEGSLRISLACIHTTVNSGEGLFLKGTKLAPTFSQVIPTTKSYFLIPFQNILKCRTFQKVEKNFLCIPKDPKTHRKMPISIREPPSQFFFFFPKKKVLGENFSINFTFIFKKA